MSMKGLKMIMAGCVIAVGVSSAVSDYHTAKEYQAWADKVNQLEAHEQDLRLSIARKQIEILVAESLANPNTPKTVEL